MKIYSRVEIDISTGELLNSEFLEYSGPVALCDRSVQSAAARERTAAGTAAGGYGAQAGTMFGNIAPTIGRWAQGETPGYGAMGLSTMLTSARATAEAAKQAGNEQARLRAMRTGNAAALAPTEAGIAGQTGRTMGQTTQDILAKNAMLKEEQQGRGLGLGASLYGTGGRLQEGAMGLANQDLRTQLEGGQSGWLQNALGIYKAIMGSGSYMPGKGLTIGRGAQG